ncbi:hypothetical protein HQQ81_20495 [Microbacteriaceae bacterium VKM Ac-2854]|nr:hypothetical protein [Microbacteriaceae bacterium VKM Ac-2854]
MSRAARIRTRRWLVRYLPPEILGTTAALLSAAAAYAAVGGGGPSALLAAAVAGTLGENLGYYALVVARGFRLHRRTAGAAHAAVLTLRGVLLEFGPAEIVDSLAVRPLLFGLGPLLLVEPWLGWLVGKLAADVVFYAVTITSYELGKRLIEPETELVP